MPDTKKPLSFGEAITTLRLRQDINSFALSKRAGIGKGLMHKIENDEKSNPTLSTMRALAKGLRVPLSVIIKLTEE